MYQNVTQNHRLSGCIAQSYDIKAWSRSIPVGIRIILGCRGVRRHSNLEGHRGLRGLICMAKKQFPMKKLYKVEGHGPAACGTPGFGMPMLGSANSIAQLYSWFI